MFDEEVPFPEHATVLGPGVEEGSETWNLFLRDAVREITDIIQAQRGYELNSKVITAVDQMLGATTQIR